MAELNTSQEDKTTSEANTKNNNQQTVSIPVPYMFSYGSLTKTLERIITASTPSRFTQDFLSTKLDLKGGSPKPVIPFLKKTGFLNSDGSPTDLYKEFRNESLRPRAAARAIKKGYTPLYEINEYVHALNDRELEGVIVQATGLDSKSKIVKVIAGTFKALKAFAKFDEDTNSDENPVEEDESEKKIEQSIPPGYSKTPVGLKLGYVINLNLPATSDIAVFDAIFKSLKKHILE